MTERKGTWREPDGEPVENDVACKAWVEVTRPALLDVAGNYGSLVTRKDLAARVQADANIHTTRRADLWISTVLTTIAADCHERGEPLLTAFCINADETVGAAYANAVLEAYGEKPEDPDAHAADERLKAHRFFGAEMPADGGYPRLPTAVARRRARAAAQVERPARAMCPNCFIEMPVDGRCGFCDEEN